MPLVSDSVKTKTYAGGVFTLGAANQQNLDEHYNFQGEVHRAHTFRSVQFHYGLNAMIGSYNPKSILQHGYPSGIAYPQSVYPGRKFYGGIGAFGGVNFVIPFEKGGEWRVVGLESNFQQEFGSYARYRKNLPDTFANAIQSQGYYHTIGVTTNIIRTLKRPGNRFGYKLGVFVATTPVIQTEQMFRYQVIPTYISNTLHFTKDRLNGFFQLNFGTYTVAFQTGASIRLGK
ncbi:MAG: hypothetical protein ABW036_07135 [Flavitalea sp.]